MTVYIDVLLFINIIINYAVLLTSSKLLKREVRLYRLILGSVVGAMFSLGIFFNLSGFLWEILIKAASSLAITAVTFGFGRFREFFKSLLLTLAVSVAFSGGYILFYQLFKPPNMVIVNNVLYLELNPLLLLALTAVIYLIIILLQKIFSERIKSTVVRLKFSACDKEYSCIGKIDTGCNLVEPFSGSSVIIADKTVFVIDDKAQKRVVPYSTVGGSSLLFAVKADSVSINGEKVTDSVYIASADKLCDSYQAIINSDIIR